MKILITNDDGIQAEGLLELYKALSKNHEVYCIAPASEKSACSNALTIHNDLKVRKTGERHYSVEGYPADCVSIGLHSSIIPEVDMVISGINHGPNLGDDIFFSGTVAGARTAYIFGKPGIAVSFDAYHRVSEYLAEAARFTAEYCSSFPEELKNSNFLLNINYPDLNENHIKGIRYTTACKRKYWDSYHIDHTKKDFLCKLQGTVHSIESPGCDSEAIREGYISITPLNVSATDEKILEKLKKQTAYEL